MLSLWAGLGRAERFGAEALWCLGGRVDSIKNPRSQRHPDRVHTGFFKTKTWCLQEKKTNIIMVMMMTTNEKILYHIDGFRHEANSTSKQTEKIDHH